LVSNIEQTGGEIPEAFNLSQNYPNPFNPSTSINFTIPESELVTLKVYNVLGKEVETLVNRNLESGSYRFNFNAENLSSGVYFYELKAGSFKEIRKMNLIK
jgi:hypothetical protein